MEMMDSSLKCHMKKYMRLMLYFAGVGLPQLLYVTQCYKPACGVCGP